MLYLIASDTDSFPDEASLAAHIEAKGYKSDALAGFIVVKGEPRAVRLKPPQIDLFAPTGSKPATKREPKAPKEPTADIKSLIMGFFAVEGAALTKAKVHTAIPGYGTDTIDNAIDWLTHMGKLTRASKTYRAAKAADTAAQS